MTGTLTKAKSEFEVADFLYHRNQMSASDIDTLLNLWGASTGTQGGAPLFQTTETCMILLTQLHLATPMESFSLRLMGIDLKAKFSSWMDTDYNFWFCNPHQLVHNIISNPDFKDGFETTHLIKSIDINGSLLLS